MKANAGKIVQSRLWNTELVDGLQTPGWVEWLEKCIC